MSRRALACLSQALETAVAEYRLAVGRAAWRRRPEAALEAAHAARRLEQLLADPEVMDLLRTSFPESQPEWWETGDPSDAPAPPLLILLRGLAQIQATARAYADPPDTPAPGLPEDAAIHRLVADRLALIAQAYLGIRPSLATDKARQKDAGFAEFVEAVADVYSIRISERVLGAAVASAVAADRLSIA